MLCATGRAMGEWIQLKSHPDSHGDAEEQQRKTGSEGEVKNSHKVVEDCMKDKKKRLPKTQ